MPGELEGVGGQRDAPAVVGQGGPVEVHTAAEQRTKGGREVLGAVASAPLQGDPGRVGPGAAELGQHRLRADLDECGAAVGDEPVHARPVIGGLAGVPADMVGAEHDTRLQPAATHVGDHRQPQRLPIQAGGFPGQLVQHGLEQRRVEGPLRCHPPVRRIFGIEQVRGSVDRLGGAGDHVVVRSVAYGQFQAGHPVQQLPHDRLVLEYGEHRARRDSPLHQPSAQPDQVQTVLNGQRSGQAEGGVLTHTVADEDVRPDPGRFQHPGQADLQGEQRRLQGLGGPLVTRVEHRLQQAGAPHLAEERIAPLQHVTHRLAVLHQPGHVARLDALTGEGEDDRPGTLRQDRASHHLSARTQRGSRVGRRSTPGDQPVAQLAPARTQGDQHILWPRRRLRVQPIGHPGGELGQRLRRLSGQRHDHRTGGHGSGRRRRRFEHDVGVGAANTERAHAGPARAIVTLRPRPGFGGQPERALGQPQLRVGLAQSGQRRDLAVAHARARLGTGPPSRRRCPDGRCWL